MFKNVLVFAMSAVISAGAVDAQAIEAENQTIETESENQAIVPEIIFPEPQLMRVTCYTYPAGSITASGQPVREGTCAAKRDWIGKTAILYDMEMNLIGIYEITDTGGHKRIRNGTSIDLFKDTLERCYEHIREYGDYGYVQIVDAKG